MTDLKGFKDNPDYIRSYPFNFHEMTAEQVMGKKRINLYVHIPFCRGGCFFCPFNRFVWKDVEVKEYLIALEEELRLISEKVNLSNLEVSTLWIGGGTPSDLNKDQIDSLFSLLERHFDLSGIEITFEGIADGRSFDEEKIGILKRHGVTNISLGVQSLNEHYLIYVLRRRYKREAALETIRLMRSAGLHINADMMYRLPGQGMGEFLTDMDDIISTGVDNITWFPFMLIRNTPIPALIEKGKLPERPGQDVYREMYKKLLERMHSGGFKEYTPYHFAKGKKIQYHVDRWHFPQLETLGVGAGAFSYFNDVLYNNLHDVQGYVSSVNKGRIPVNEGKGSTDMEKVSRCLVLGMKGLRVNKGEFKEFTGFDMDSLYRDEIDGLVGQGLLEENDEEISLTTLGKAFSNEVSKGFYTDYNKGFNQPLGVDYRK